MATLWIIYSPVINTIVCCITRIRVLFANHFTFLTILWVWIIAIFSVPLSAGHSYVNWILKRDTHSTVKVVRVPQKNENTEEYRISHTSIRHHSNNNWLVETNITTILICDYHRELAIDLNHNGRNSINSPAWSSLLLLQRFIVPLQYMSRINIFKLNWSQALRLALEYHHRNGTFLSIQSRAVDYQRIWLVENV